VSVHVRLSHGWTFVTSSGAAGCRPACLRARTQLGNPRHDAVRRVGAVGPTADRSLTPRDVRPSPPEICPQAPAEYWRGFHYAQGWLSEPIVDRALRTPAKRAKPRANSTRWPWTTRSSPRHLALSVHADSWSSGCAFSYSRSRVCHFDKNGRSSRLTIVTARCSTV